MTTQERQAIRYFRSTDDEYVAAVPVEHVADWKRIMPNAIELPTSTVRQMKSGNKKWCRWFGSEEASSEKTALEWSMKMLALCGIHVQR